MDNIIGLIKLAAVDAVEAAKPVNLLYGKVVSESPVKVQIDQKIILQEPFLVLTRNVTEYTFDMTVAHETEQSEDVIDTTHSHDYSGETEQAELSVQEMDLSHSHPYGGTTEPAGAQQTLIHSHGYSGKKSFTVHNGLRVGERVLLARMQEGQTYVVLDRC